MSISDRARNAAGSPTLAITAKVKALKAQGVDIVGFGAGEPDFDTPENVKEAAVKAIQQGFTKYTPTSGIDELKDAIIMRLKTDSGLDYTKKQIIVSDGAKHSLYNAFMVLVNPGDEVIIPAPFWVTYPEQVKLAGGVPVYVQTKVEDGFKLKASQVLEAITDKTKVILINSPCNPTGAVYEPEELEQIADIASSRGINIISDEIYDKLVYDDNKSTSIAALGEGIKNITITINGVSKTYAMTGWRIGYAAASDEIVAAMSRIQDHSTSNPTSIAQKAAVEALTGPQDIVETMRREFDKRRKFMVEKLNSIDGIECPTPGGAFYVFPKVSGLYKGDVKGSNSFAEYLLTNAKVAVVPGFGFGADDCVRLSYATSMANIEKGLDRIEAAAKVLIKL